MGAAASLLKIVPYSLLSIGKFVALDIQPILEFRNVTSRVRFEIGTIDPSNFVFGRGGSRLSEQFIRIDKWSVCRVKLPSEAAAS